MNDRTDLTAGRLDRNDRRISFQLGRSVRSYRELMNAMIRRAWRGEVSWDEVAKCAAGVKPAVEMLLAERQLMSLGGDNQADNPFDPVEMIEDMGPAKQYKRVKVTARTGVDKHGAVVDDKTVAVEGSALDAQAIEAEAEVRTLA